MKQPTLLKANINKDEAIEIMNYLYCEKIYRTELDNDYIKWYNIDNELIGKWTSEYKNLMISKILLDI